MLQLRPCAPGFVAEASGVDLRGAQPLSVVEAIERGLDKFGVLVFRDQPLTQGEQMGMTSSFGPLDLGLKKVKKSVDRLEFAELADISNVGADGKPVDREDRKIVSNIANQLWHSDSSFQRPAGRYSMLAAAVVPSWGGATEFADMRAAYDALPAREKAEAEGLDAEHYALHSRFMLGDDAYTEEQRAAIAPVVWPVVRTHPSGRRHLFIGVHARRVVGMTVAEGRMLLSDLQEHAVQRRFVFSHEWRVGDLLMWDNRTTLHRGRRYDLSEPRELRRSTTEDTDRAAIAA